MGRSSFGGDKGVGFLLELASLGMAENNVTDRELLEHARGDFYVPLATTEGTVVASYNRGMRLLTECGGVSTTVVEEYMQRAPVFVLRSAMEALASRFPVVIGPLV